MDKSDDENIKFLRQNKYKKLEWSDEESAIRFWRTRRESSYSKYDLDFSDAVISKLRKSIFGTYIDILNNPQIQDNLLNENKLAITDYDLKGLKGRQQEIFEEKNAIFHDATGLLKSLVSYQEVVKYQFLRETVNFLRISDYYMNKTNGELRKFTNLQVLVLSGNNLKEIDGSVLPRRLKFLELYDNFIQDITNLVNKTPGYLLHLGLGRNMLNNNSSLHLLASSNNFTHLRNLDLSDNDISDLIDVLTKTRELPNMRSLQLEGNPCYVESNYKQTTIRHIPGLSFLDNVELSKGDRVAASETSSDENNRTPQMIFYCHRIMGLRPPPKDRKCTQTIHLEIKLPLLERIVLIEKTIENIQIHTPTLTATQSKTVKKQDKKGADKGKKETKASPYDAPDEYYPQSEEYNVSFKTEKLQWNHIMQFRPIFIESKEGGNVYIRDTLRTRVKVDVVYTKAAPQSKKSKKGGKKGEKESETMTTKSKNTKSTESTAAEDIPEETILKKVTLYSFYCNLQSINWSDESVDYIWMDHPKFGNDGSKTKCLKDLVYSERLGKTRKKSRKEDDTLNNQDPSPSLAIPKMFTCHVGFGLKRNSF